MIIQPIIKKKLPDLQLLTFEMDVKVKESNPEFWQESNSMMNEIIGQLKMEDISQLPANKATREAYKVFGKDPSRYRPSAEALLRRIINGKGLYHVNNVVDCLNLLSVRTGFSIGGFDQDLIQGEASLSLGDQSEYKAIGRGVLNIEYLPTLFDEIGPFGTPTSDSMRTMVSVPG